MVKSKLNQLLLTVFLSVVSSACFSAPQLIMFADKTEAEIGRPIRLELYAISINSKISSINLNPIKHNFGVVTDYIINDTSDNRWPNKKIQILKLKIYPRKPGTLTVPSVGLNNVLSNAITLQIKNGKTGTAKITLSTREPFQRQQFFAYVSLTTTEPTARLSIKESINIPDFDVYPLSFKRTQLEKGKYRLETGFALNALKNGFLPLKFPPVHLSVSGVSRKQFYFPLKTINIKMLPMYIPPTTAVGKVNITGNLSTNDILQPDSLYYWNIKLSGNVNNSYQLPAILRQIKSNAQYTFFTSDIIRSQKRSGTHLISTVEYSIPFKISGSGILKLPPVYLQYFNPATNKIERFVYQSEKRLTLSYFWQSILILLISIMIVVLLKPVYKQWQQYLHSAQKREQAIKRLENANNTEALRDSIRLFSESEYWPSNLTISQWKKLWQQRYQTHKGFEETISNLSSCLYNNNKNCDLNQLTTQLLSLFENRNKK